MTNETLIQTLQTLVNRSRDWRANLEVRKQEELTFHNQNRDKALTASLPQDTYELLHGNKKFYNTVELVRNYTQSWLAKNVPGKVFLDYACGNGGQVIQAAQHGAAISIGIDLSDVSIQNAREAAKEAGVSDRCFFIEGDCENTGLPADCIDVILCSGVLHHMDLSFAFPEMRRVLKPGGKVLAGEALNYNPAIKLYREMTPSMRTEWEKNHILSLKDVAFAQRFFELGEIRFWHLFSVGAAFFRKNGTVFNGLLRAFNFMDSLILRIPGLRLMAWQFTFELKKANT